MPPHTTKNIYNSHKPRLEPKIAKEIVCLPTLFCLRRKTKQGQWQLENVEIINEIKKSQQVTKAILNKGFSGNLLVNASDKNQ